MNIIACVTIVCVAASLTPLCMASCYGGATEGEEYNLTCSNSLLHAFDGLYWRVDTDSTSKWIATCFQQNDICNNLFPDIFVATFEERTSILTVKNVSRTDPFNMETARWTCVWIFDWYNDTECFGLPVIALPERPICDEPELNMTSFEILVTCRISKIYPEPSCRMELSMDNSSFSSTTLQVSYQHSTTYENNVLYYKSQCTLTLPLGTLASYGNYIKVRMYPRYGNSVYSDVFQIDLAIVKNEIVTSTKETQSSDPSHASTITLGVFMVLFLCVSIALAFVLYWSKRRSSMHPTSPTPVLPETKSRVPVPKRYNKFNQSGQAEGHSQSEKAEGHSQVEKVEGHIQSEKTEGQGYANGGHVYDEIDDAEVTEMANKSQHETKKGNKCVYENV